MTINRTTLHTGLGLGVLALAIGAWLLLRDSGHQSTNNAYVVADYTLVAPKIPGFVSAVEVEDNQSVKAGDVLARIDDRDYQVALQAARADLDDGVRGEGGGEQPQRRARAGADRCRATKLLTAASGICDRVVLGHELLGIRPARRLLRSHEPTLVRRCPTPRAQTVHRILSGGKGTMGRGCSS